MAEAAGTSFASKLGQAVGKSLVDSVPLIFLLAVAYGLVSLFWGWDSINAWLEQPIATLKVWQLALIVWVVANVAKD